MNLSSVYLFDFAEWRRAGSIDTYDEILKEAAATQKTRHGKIAGESCHRLKEVAEHNNLNLVEIHQGFRAANDSAKLVLDAILQAANSQ